jgi:hypothetical protein
MQAPVPPVRQFGQRQTGVRATQIAHQDARHPAWLKARDAVCCAASADAANDRR